MSRYRNYDDPIFFTPPTDSPDGRRRLYKGGGGQRDATPEERRLWAAQAASLENLTNAAFPALTTSMGNLTALANEAMDGTQAARLRNMALSDVNVALGTSVNDVLRTLAAYGMTPQTLSLNRAYDVAANWGLDAAKQRAAAAYLANIAAEDTKWQRNAAIAGLASGQGATAVSGLGSLAGQIGQDRAMSNKIAAEDAMGRGMMSAYISKQMLGLKDGGPVSGGLRYYRPGSSNMPSLSNLSFSGSSRNSDALFSTLQPIALGFAADAAKPVIRPLVQKAKDFVGNQFAGLTSVPLSAVPEQTAMLAAQNAGLTEGASQLATLAAQDAAFLPASQAGSALAAETAGALGAEAAGAASTLGAIAPAVPWLAAGYALGSLFGLWKDGGAVKAPGMPTDEDTVPAMLSNREYVVNAKATGLKRRETLRLVDEWKREGGSTRDLLEKINNRGLVKRYGSEGGK